MPSVKVDQEACIGCGACVAACEEGFTMVDNKSKPTNAKPDALTCHKEAADVCPVSCIAVTE